jgi:CRP-like cAMP-binding protein
VNDQPHTAPSPISPNKLLARLPADDYRRLLPDLERIRIRAKRALVQPSVPARKIYFLSGGVCSISQVMADGQMAGVAVVGNEGLVGMGALGGDPESGQTAVVEIADGDAQVMDVKAFHREMARQTSFSHLVHRYAQAFVESLMQSVACNALHPIEKRCARYLLEIRDRVGGNEFPLTQDVLAMLLGVRRASVTLAAGTLHRAGLIDHAHRNIVIIDPAGLEHAACECYAIIKGHFARLLP